MSLKLKKGGVLELTEWNYDEDKGEGKYDVSELDGVKALFQMHNPISLEPGVTLRDVMVVVEKLEEPLTLMMPHCFIPDYIKASKLPPEKETEIDYLELYTHLEKDNEEYDLDKPRYLNGLYLPSFHGISKPITKEDLAREDFEAMGYKEGERFAWSLSFQPIANLLDLEVKICDTVVVSDGIDYQEKTTEIKATPRYSLFQFLYGILWELSWYGTPEEAAAKGKEVLDIAKEAKEHPERLVPLKLEDL